MSKSKGIALSLFLEIVLTWPSWAKQYFWASFARLLMMSDRHSFIGLMHHFNANKTKGSIMYDIHYVLWAITLLILTLYRWLDRWRPLLRWRWLSWYPPWTKRSYNTIRYNSDIGTFDPTITHCVINFNCPYQSCDDGNSQHLHTNRVLFNSIHSINGTGTQWKHHS